MTPDQLKAAAQVMLDAAKPGAIVEYACRCSRAVDWRNAPNPIWDWKLFDYRIVQPKHTTLDDLPPVCWVRKTDSPESFLALGADSVFGGGSLLLGGEWAGVSSLRGTHEYSADRKTWTPFSLIR
jgi:hypothetical protein